MNTPYFRLRMAKDIVKPPKFEKLPPGRYPYKMNGAAFNALDDLVVAYYLDSIGLQFPDFLHDPTFMVTTPQKKLFTLFDPALQFKGIQLYPQDITRLDLPMPLYWIPYLAPTDCLHESSIFYGTGIVKQLVVDSRKADGRDILKVKGTVEEIWLVSLAAAECILRRMPLGAGLNLIEVK